MAKFSIQSITRISDNTDIYETEPVTVAELKNFLQIEGDAYNSSLSIFITASRMMIENMANVSLTGKSLRVQIQNPNFKPFPLPLPPVEEVTQVEWQKCRSTKVILDNPDDWEFVDDSSDYKEIESTKKGLFFINYLTSPNTEGVFKKAVMAQAAYQFNNRDSDKDIKISPEAEALIAPFKTNFF